MLVNVYRIFCGEYIADPQILQDKKVQHFNIKKPAYFITDEDMHGHGQIRGSTKKVGETYSPVPVCCFKRSNRQLIWETTSNPDGSYVFRNIAKGLECFVVAFDPNEEYNAVISDKVVAK